MGRPSEGVREGASSAPWGKCFRGRAQLTAAAWLLVKQHGVYEGGEWTRLFGNPC
eukprot:COSAG02_NODE_1168_length_14134_cov_19.590310_11_plen_55_part_00